MTQTRHVIHQDALTWLASKTFEAHEAIFTSLPDVSEMGSMPFDEWKIFFTRTSHLLIEKCHPHSVAIFYQTDIKHEGEWVDKSHLVQKAADETSAKLLWHKVVCRVPPGTTTFGRPAFAHLLCFSKELRALPKDSTADVLPELGAMTWARAMGLNAARLVCQFIKKHTQATTLIDPFCGVGTALACANEVGLNAIGVEKSLKRVRQAETLSV